MPKVTLNNGDTGLVVRGGINTMFDEVYAVEPGLTPTEIVEAIDVELGTEEWRVATGLCVPQGPWSGSTTYAAGAVVAYLNAVYFLPTGTSLNQVPGVAGAWEVWMNLTGLADSMTFQLPTVTAMDVFYFPVGRNFTCTSWSVIVDQVTTASISVWQAAGFPTVSDKISASAPIVLTAAQVASSSALTGWTTALVAGQYIAFSLDSASAGKTGAITLLGVRA